MNLAKFASMAPEERGEGGNDFLKFTAKDNIKIVRFLYGSSDEIECRRKLYDKATNKVIWDTEEGKWTMQLSVAVYTSKTEYELMTWDRSARFGADVLIPIFEAAGGEIRDTVYKITCSNAGTLEAKYSLFPMKNSDDYAMPDIEEEEEDTESEEEDEEEEEPAPKKSAKPTQKAAPKSEPKEEPKKAAAPAPKKKRFWEED